MKNQIRILSRGFGAAVMLSAATASTAVAQPVRWANPEVPAPTIELTEHDVQLSNQDVVTAYKELVTMWTADFKQLGRRFVAPGIANYRGAIRTGCGVMRANNAAYCAANNAIYFDEVFVAGQVKEAANRLGTDGDMAGVGVIAHEMGHAVAAQLGVEGRTSYDNEAIADCLAGSFASYADADGYLDPGDLDEAFVGLAAAGDPKVELTGNRRVDRRIEARMAAVSHGTGDQRMANFKAGYEEGTGACLPQFRKSSR
jgi:predicted metalloprotease